VIFDDAPTGQAAAILERRKRALDDGAELWERRCTEPPAVVLFALPPPGPSWDDQ